MLHDFALQHEAAAEWEQAADYWLRYVKLQPEDSEARIHLAVAFGKTAESIEELARASEYYSVAIGHDSQRVELQRELAGILFRSANPIAAANRARQGLKLAPRDPECLKLLALSMQMQARLTDEVTMTDVVQVFADALETNPRDIELTNAAARFYREEFRELSQAKRCHQADEIMNRLVSQAPDAPDLLLSRYEYRRKYQVVGADADLDRALEVAPNHASSLYFDGVREFERRAYLAAEGRFRSAIAAAATDHRGYLGLAKSLSVQGKRTEAVDALRRGIPYVEGADLVLRSEWASLLTSMGRLDEAQQIIDGLDRTAGSTAPLLNPAERIELRNGIDLLRCRWMLSSGNYVGTIQQLRGLLTTPMGAHASSLLQHSQAYLMVGKCHAALRQWDLAAGAYEQAARLQPFSAMIRVQQAEALEQSGQHERAISIYEQALRMTDVPNTARTSLAWCRLRYQLRRPESERDWAQFETDLVTAQQSQTEALGVVFLQANFAASQGRKEDAIEILRKSELDYSEQTDAWASLAVAYEQWGYTKDADRAWLRYRQLKGPSGEEVALRCELLCRRQEFDAARTYVQERLPLLRGDDLRLARTTAAFLELRAGRSEVGTQLLEKLAQDFPDDIRCLEALGEISLERADFTRTRQVELALAKAEGVDGCGWRELECRRMFAQPGRRTKPELTRLARLQSEMEALRPNWPRGFLVKGMLAEVRNDTAGAIAAYERALQLGGQRPELYRQLIPLLFIANRLADANRYLAMLGPGTVVDLRTTFLSINANLRSGQEERAVAIARQTADSDPKNVMAKIWLGQTLLATRQVAEAEKALREAVASHPEDPRSWMGLFGLLMQEKKPVEGRAILEELGKHAALNAETRAFLQAQGHEMLGNHAEAKKLYLKARDLAPNDVTIQQTCGLYLMRQSPDDAERSLRRVLDMSPSSGSARRALASILAARGGEKSWQEAWELLQNEADADSVSAADERLRALLLVHRGSLDNRRQALEVMERLVARLDEPMPGDRWLLARLYDDLGRFSDASRELLLLTGRHDCDAVHLAAFIDFLLRHERFSDVEPPLKRLEERVPDSLATLGFRARWFQGVKKESEIRPLIDGFVSRRLGQTAKVTERGQLLLEAANLYSALKMTAEAERLYRQLMEASPREYRFLARFLVLSERTSEAVSLCLQAAETQDLAASAALLCSVLSRGQATAVDHARSEPVIQRALAAHHDDISFLFSVATLRYFQQRKEEAMQLYMKVLERFPEHVAVLNNLANLASEIPSRRSEAIEYINRAIAVQGPHADLLDTLGVVLLRNGQPTEALKALEQACAYPAPDARYFFHLSLAHLKNGESGEARKALARAVGSDLNGQALTAEERLSLSSLQLELAEK